MFQASGSAKSGIDGAITFTPKAHDGMRLSFKYGTMPSKINPKSSKDIEAKVYDELHDSTQDIQVEFKTTPS